MGVRAIWMGVLLGILPSLAWAQEAADPRLWLEEVEGTAALDWVRAQNAESVAAITADPQFEVLRARLLEIYDSDDRIAYPSEMGGQWYSFWRDAAHPRGVWRRTSPEAYRAGGEVPWEVVFDLDALATAEGENWVWHGASCLRPDYDRCLITLSRGGADAGVVREWDMTQRSFVEGGFFLPEAKSEVRWIDRDTVFVATDFGEGSMTESGYPRIVKRWTRGTPLEQATVVLEGPIEDVEVGAYHDDTPGYERDFAYRALTFYSSRQWWVHPKKGLIEIPKPESASASVWKDWILLELRDDWTVDGTTYKSGSLVAAPFKRFMKGKTRGMVVLFEPTERASLSGFSTTRDHLLLTTLEDVQSRITVLTPGKKVWASRSLDAGGGPLDRVSIWAEDPDDSNAFFATVQGYTVPTTLYEGSLDTPDAAPVALRSLPAFFDAEDLTVTQHFATSKDGTKVPYFQVAPKDIPLDGSNPTLLYGYGGFEVSLTPGYSASVGATWLERGGVYVVANIRGGGEYGPRWHQAALKQNRMRAYEDFAAVGEDLVARGVTQPAHLAIRGGSNGGLLMGNMLTLYPDHWGAIHCAVPLLDMRRYHTLLAGASWMGEYGDPDDPAQWDFMRPWSPYQTAAPETVAYPPILFTTSTRDDRVHPGHARKLAAKLMDGGEDDVLYYENIEGGHGGAANNEQSAFMDALAYTFLWNTVHGQTPTPPPPPPTEEPPAPVPPKPKRR